MLYGEKMTVSDVTLQVACTLSSAELLERKATLIRELAGAVTGIEELSDGYAYQLPSEAAWLHQIATLIELERQCCPFLSFQLTAGANNAFLRLEMTGPEGTKEFLTSLVNDAVIAAE
jgi:hypothetical protein